MPYATTDIHQESELSVMGWVFIAIGTFAICGAAMDWDWFMNSRRARFFVSVFGRMGARIFYGLLGIALMVFGILAIMGIIQPS